MMADLRQIFAGAAAGAIEYAVCQPIDIVKTRLHIAGNRGRTVRGELTSIYTNGGVRSLYRGLGPQILAAVPISIGMYVGHSMFLRGILSLSNGGVGDGGAAASSIPWRASALAGFCSGFTEGTIATPFEVAKVRLHHEGHNARYANTIAVFAAMARENTAFRGWQATCARNAVFNSVFFACVALGSSCKKGVSSSSTAASSSGSNFLRDMAIGFSAAQVATLFKMPFDVAKSRTQAEVATAAAAAAVAGESSSSSSSSCSGLRYGGSIVTTVTTIAREEGVGALYRGTVPTALRMGIGMAVGLATFELLKQENK